MGRERRGPNGCTYHYRKSRDADGRVVSTYFGNGPIAVLVAETDAARRAFASYRTAALSQFEERVDAADAAVRACTKETRERLAVALEAEGYRYHRGEWRRPRRSRDPNTN